MSVLQVTTVMLEMQLWAAMVAYVGAIHSKQLQRVGLRCPVWWKDYTTVALRGSKKKVTRCLKINVWAYFTFLSPSRDKIIFVCSLK
jgi:hypothetical protein